MPTGRGKSVQGDVCLDRAQTLADLCRIVQNPDLASPDWYLKLDLLPKRRQDVSAKEALQHVPKLYQIVKNCTKIAPKWGLEALCSARKRYVVTFLRYLRFF